MHPYPWYHPQPIVIAVPFAIARRDALMMTIPSALSVLASAARRPWQLMGRVGLGVVVVSVAVPVVVPVAEPVVALVAAIAAALNTDPAVAPVDQSVVASRALVGRTLVVQVR